MSSTCTQIQPCTATPISSLSQFLKWSNFYLSTSLFAGAMTEGLNMMVLHTTTKQ